MRNKRIALNDEDIVLICSALEKLHKDSVIAPSLFSEHELSSRQRINEIRRKLGRDSLPLIKVEQIKQEARNATQNKTTA